MNSGFSYLTQTQENKWVFYAAGNSWQVWDKPDGCNMIHIVMIGAGAAGGGAIAKSAGVLGAGGGGGGGGGWASLTIPSYAIPEKLHILVGVGPTNTGAAGSSPSATYVSLIPTTGINASILLYTSTLPTGGGKGSVTGGAAGAGGAITSIINYGKFSAFAGTAGQAGGLIADYAQTSITGGGAGGSASTASDVTGNNVVSSYKQPSAIVVSKGSVAGSTTQSGNGPNLISPQSQFFAGAGGASNNSTTASQGGDGGIGCGGGGGGCGLTITQAGGKGGDGLVIITCW